MTAERLRRPQGQNFRRIAVANIITVVSGVAMHTSLVGHN